MAKSNIQPKENHFTTVMKIMKYLKTFPKRELLFDTFFRNHAHVNWNTHDWTEMYFDTKEEILMTCLHQKGSL